MKIKYIILFATLPLISLFAEVKNQSNIQNNTNEGSEGKEAVQDTTVERDVSIYKEFVPEIAKSKRFNIELPSTEPKVKKNEVNYSKYYKKYYVQSPFSPTKQNEFGKVIKKEYKKGYLSAGIGYPLNWNVDFFVPIGSVDKIYSDILLNHNGYNHGIKKLIDTDLNFNIKAAIGRSEIYSNVGYTNSYYTYYGNEYNPISNDNLDSQTLNKLNALVGLQSKEGINGWNYNVNINYDLLGVRNSNIFEHQINAFAMASKELGSFPLAIAVDLDNIIYSTPEYVAADNWKNNSILQILPSYQMSWEKISLDLGAKLIFSFNKGSVFSITPDVKFKYDVNEVFNLYANFGGDIKSNTLSQNIQENRYISINGRPQYNTVTPIDAKLGFITKPLKGFMIEANVGYSYLLNNNFYRSSYNVVDNIYYYTNRFESDYQNVGLLKAHLNLGYEHKYFNTYIAGRYTKAFLTEDEKTGLAVAYHLPTWETELRIDIKPTKDLIINASYLYGSDQFNMMRLRNGTAYVVNAGEVHDFNLGATYTLFERYALYIKANNILGFSKTLNYQKWYGYDSLGGYITIGAAINF